MKYSIRDLLLVTVIVALALGWCVFLPRAAPGEAPGSTLGYLRAAPLWLRAWAKDSPSGAAKTRHRLNWPAPLGRTRFWAGWKPTPPEVLDT